MTSPLALRALAVVLALIAVAVELLARQATIGGRLALDLLAVVLASGGLALAWRVRSTRRGARDRADSGADSGDRFHTEPRREA